MRSEEQLITAAFPAPIQKLLSNSGILKEEAEAIIHNLELGLAGDTVAVMESEIMVYDALEQQFVDPFENGLLDSLPAVLEAIRNSISAAVLLGTCGGTVVFARDGEFDKKEAGQIRSWLREVEEGGTNPANERG